MTLVTLSTVPGFSDLPDVPLASGKIAIGNLLSRINFNASFGMVRLEVFTGIYKHGDQVPVPTSAVDGYVYQPSELMYAWVPQNTANPQTGWASYREPWTMWYGVWNVDSTGKVYSEVGYRGNSDHKDRQATTNDGQVQVFTIAQRQLSSLIMAAQPSFAMHVDADFYVNRALNTGLMTDLNHDAKFGIANTEVMYMGQFANGATVPQPVSPIDGYVYPYAQVQFMTSFRWTADTDGAGNPIKPAINKGQLQDWSSSVNPANGVVQTQVTYELNGPHFYTTGEVAVFAFCSRPLGTTYSTQQNNFVEILDSTFAPGSSLQAATMQQMNRNIGQAVCTPEFFGPTVYTNGQTIPLPVSPADGYTYARTELLYVWDWANTGPETVNKTGRLSVVHGAISAAGVVTVTDYRFYSGASTMALETQGQMRVIVIGKRANSISAPPIADLAPPNFASDQIAEWFGNLDTTPDGTTFGRNMLSFRNANQPSYTIGLNLITNPDFANASLAFMIPGASTQNYAVYDNNGTGNVTIAAVTNQGSIVPQYLPNRSGYALKINVANGSAPTPGIGGFSVRLSPDNGTSQVGAYHKGNTVVWKIVAKIPKAFSLNFASNAYGSDGGSSAIGSWAGIGDNGPTWGPQAGQGGPYNWQIYLLKQNIGTFGSFSSTGFFYLTYNNGSTNPNVIPDSDNQSSTWTLAGSPTWFFQGLFSAAQSLWPGVWELQGTGAASGGGVYAQSGIVTVVPNTVMTLSINANATQVTAGTPQVFIYDPTVTTQYAALPVPNTTNGRVSIQWTVPGGVTQVRILIHTNNCTIANGQFLFMGNPQLEAASSMSEYVPNPVLWYVAECSAIDLDVPQNTGQSHSLMYQGVSSVLNVQGNIPPGQAITISFTYNDTSISLSWSAQSILRADQSTLSIPAGTQNYTGLTASTQYHIYPYINAQSGLIGFSNGSPPPSGAAGNPTNAIQAAFDTRIPTSPINITTLATGGTGGSGSGGGGGNCPEQNEKADVFGRGETRAIDVNVGELVLGYSFKQGKDVYRRVVGKHVRSCPAWSKLDGYLVSPAEPVWVGPLDSGSWMGSHAAPGSELDTTISVEVRLTVEADENDEHNFWLVGRAVRRLIHNFQPYC